MSRELDRRISRLEVVQNRYRGPQYVLLDYAEDSEAEPATRGDPMTEAEWLAAHCGSCKAAIRQPRRSP